MALYIKLKHRLDERARVRLAPARATLIGGCVCAAMTVLTAAAAPIAAAAVWGGMSAFTDGSGAPAGSGPALGPFSSAELGPALLTADQVSALSGTHGASLVHGPAAGFLDTAKDISDPDCASPWGPAEASSYTDGSYSGLAVGTATDSVTHPQHTVTQAVIGFSDEGALRRYKSRIAVAWRSCATHAITYAPPDNPSARQTWQLGSADSDAEHTIMIMSQHLSGGDWECERAFASTTSNIAIDVLVCGHNPKGQASQAIRTITTQVPA